MRPSARPRTTPLPVRRRALLGLLWFDKIRRKGQSTHLPYIKEQFFCVLVLFILMCVRACKYDINNHNMLCVTVLSQSSLHAVLFYS